MIDCLFCFKEFHGRHNEPRSQASPYATGSAPTAHYPQYPGTQYPGTQYPGAQYPGTQYPGTQYPGAQYPGAPYPGSQNVGTQYPGTQFPGTQYHGSQSSGTPSMDQKPGYPQSGDITGNSSSAFVSVALLFVLLCMDDAMTSAVDSL